LLSLSLGLRVPLDLLTLIVSKGHIILCSFLGPHSPRRGLSDGREEWNHVVEFE
jgi:hypothetical protein